VTSNIDSPVHKRLKMYKMHRIFRYMHYWASVMHKSSTIDTLLPIENMAAETGCGSDFISWLSSPYLDLGKKKEAVLRHIHPTRVQKGRVVTPRDCSQSNVSVTFRFHVAVYLVHKGSPFKYAGMKFNPQHPFPAQLCLVVTIDATSGLMQRAAILQICVYIFFFNLSFLVDQTE